MITMYGTAISKYNSVIHIIRGTYNGTEEQADEFFASFVDIVCPSVVDIEKVRSLAEVCDPSNAQSSCLSAFAIKGMTVRGMKETLRKHLAMQNCTVYSYTITRNGFFRDDNPRLRYERAS